ncbi:hypothetical protein [Acetobacter vaccinii]|uniref:Uncharacterized protein n=1 Tax=Acetobacter vaccinii TaxID=2592655 RepID=A0A5C1YNK2_9PROT|nr:hypothetical protein [Acetobacter vaccinii]QEO17088.1 hypothetical protein FLP30_04465 [Acetobacter vaccinii]
MANDYSRLILLTRCYRTHKTGGSYWLAGQGCCPWLRFLSAGFAVGAAGAVSGHALLCPFGWPASGTELLQADEQGKVMPLQTGLFLSLCLAAVLSACMTLNEAERTWVRKNKIKAERNCYLTDPICPIQI